ncbi:hypothetical protein ABZ622_37670 [Streptomyces sp. NPDC007164]
MGQLQVPGTAVEAAVVIKLGTWPNNVRKRTAGLTEQRRADLDKPGIRW